MASNAPDAAAPPVPVGIDLGSLHARLAVTDALQLTDVTNSAAGHSGSKALPEPRVVSNAQGSRYTLAASTLDVTHPIDEYGDDNGGNKQDEVEQVQFIFGDAARKALTRNKRPLGQSLVRQLSMLSICNSVDWTTDGEEEEDDIVMGDKDQKPEEAPGPAPAVEEAEAKTAAQASSAFFANLANLACDATSSHPTQLRAVVSVPAGADRRIIRGVVDSAERGLDEAIAEAQGKEKGKQNGKNNNKKKGKRDKNDGGKVVGVLTDPSAVCLAHGLADASPSTVELGSDNSAANSSSNQPGPSNWRHALVVDWGASGLTLSHVTRMGSSNILSIVSTTNDASLSGRTLTELLVSHCASQFERKCRVAGVLDSKKSKARLEAACEIAIRTLGRATSCHVTVDGLYEGMDMNVPVSRPRFDMLCGPSLRKAEAQVKAIKEALAGSDGGASFDVVLLAGNVSLMPSVKAMIDRLFPAASEDGTPAAWRGRTDIPPDEAVAMGCAKHAAALVDPARPTPPPEGGGDRRRFWRQEAVVTSPVAIGVCTWGDDSKKCPPVPLIEVGTPLPALASKKIAWGEGGDATLGIVQMIDGGDGSCQEKLLGRINDISSGSELAIELTKEGKLSVSIDGGESVAL